MSVTSISASANAAAQAASAHSDAASPQASGVSVRFAPEGAASAPLDRVGSGVMNQLREFEANRAERTKSVNGVTGGPATAYDAAKSELTSGPASVGAAEREASGPASSIVYEDAVAAMTRGFDYAIETQLIVKTGSQFSTSASSLMRGQ